MLNSKSAPDRLLLSEGEVAVVTAHFVCRLERSELPVWYMHNTTTL